MALHHRPSARFVFNGGETHASLGLEEHREYWYIQAQARRVCGQPRHLVPFMLLDAMPAMPCHAETACPSPLWAWPHARSHHRAPLIATPSCQSLPPQTSLPFLRVRGAVNSTLTRYPTYLLHTVHTRYLLLDYLTVLSALHPVHDAHGRTLLILRGRRMDPACWQPEKGCPAVGLTWVCWQS